MISQLIFGVMFLSFSCHMYVDSVVLLEYFLLENERSWVYFVCLNVPSVAPM